MSNASLSNIESKGKGSSKQLVENICTKMSIEPSVFAKDPGDFLDELPDMIRDHSSDSEEPVQKTKKKQINYMVDRLTRYFADQMLSGRLKKGDQIPNDRELAATMGVGRTTIREALKVLDIMGMIDIRPGQGTFITGQENDFFMIPISWSLFMNASQIDQILEVRDTLEEKAASLAALHRVPQKMARLEAIMKEMSSAHEAGDLSVFSDTDTRFHAAIADLSENDIIYALGQTISNLIHQVSGTGLTTPAQMEESYLEHQRIYETIRIGDTAEARAAMHDHLQRAHHRYNYS
ncbi:MAG: FadR/GntR family transcriptional regulator [Lachnospiraceae bacterium]|nr:FadR/GntR family transcriptional regulator [Lachnospiraceae bacterium]